MVTKSFILKDILNGFFLNVNDQISMACSIIQQDPQLANGYNAIGFSQGLNHYIVQIRKQDSMN